MKYLCPKCKDHPGLMNNLDCYSCKGRYVWKENDPKSELSEPKGRITITDVKVIGMCSSCRDVGDEIPIYKDGSVINDDDISCLNKAFGKCSKLEKGEEK